MIERACSTCRGLCVGLLLLLAAVSLAQAHQTSLTVGRIVVDGAEVHYRLRVSAHDLALVLDIPTDLATAIPMERFAARLDLLREYLDEMLSVSADGSIACQRTSLAVSYRRLPEEIDLDLLYTCPVVPRRLTIVYRLFFAVDLAHRAIGTIDYGGGPVDYVLQRNAGTLEVDPTERNTFLAFTRIVALGIEHILIGIDHVLFVVALLLGGGRFWPLARIVTAFTAAHSLTLALAWFGWIDVPARPVEILIAASVAFVALTNALGRGMQHRWRLAFAFGLVHGLGLYGVLSELGIESGSTLRTLLAFNLGVELGQLAIVAMLLPLLIWAARRAWYRRAMLAGSLAILALAMAWLVERAWLA